MSSHSSVKEQVVHTCETLLDRGYLKANEGNVSIRIPGTDRFAITPSGLDYARMHPEDVCILDTSLRQLEGELKPSIESGLHAAAYVLREDVQVVVHTHQPLASALAIMRKPIPALFDEQVRYLGRGVPIVPYAPSGTALLRRNVKAKLRAGGNAFILANHGVLVLGTDPDNVLHNLALLEKCAESYLLSLMTGAQTRGIPLAVREIAFRQLKGSERAAAAPAAPPEDGGRETAQRDGVAAGAGRPSPPTGSELAISEYPDVDAVHAGLERLVEQPLRRLSRSAMADYLDYFEAKCQRSKELTDEAKRYIPGGVQHNLAFNHPFPLAVARAEGAYMWDVDGNEYIDFLQAGGPTVLGSNHPAVQEKVIEVLRRSGPVTGLFHEYEVELAKLVQRLVPSVELFRMFGSGTESVMAAVRAARAATGKKFVIKSGGAYHGWSDQMVYGMHVPGTRRFEAKGVPWSATSHTCEVYPDSIPALRRKLLENRTRGGTAAVIVEPLGPESGTRPVHFGYNAAVRDLCDEFGALLIFDEVVTGFRTGMSCAQGYFGVRPDLTVFGKCIAGGYPMAGAVGGRADVMSCFAAGIGGTGERAYVGGTLSANPLSAAAGYFALSEMERTGAPVLAGRAGDRLRQGLQGIIDRRGLPYVVFNTGSIVHLETSGVMFLDTHHPLRLARELKPRKEMLEAMGAAYTANGIITLAGSRIYTSMADSDAVVDEALARFDDVFSNAEAA
jgi:glutamate-1-semialdehyde 2,1-aminomutase